MFERGMAAALYSATGESKETLIEVINEKGMNHIEQQRNSRQKNKW